MRGEERQAIGRRGKGRKMWRGRGERGDNLPAECHQPVSCHSSPETPLTLLFCTGTRLILSPRTACGSTHFARPLGGAIAISVSISHVSFPRRTAGGLFLTSDVSRPETSRVKLETYPYRAGESAAL